MSLFDVTIVISSSLPLKLIKKIFKIKAIKNNKVIVEITETFLFLTKINGINNSKITPLSKRIEKLQNEHNKIMNIFLSKLALLKNSLNAIK
jgi:hypothetical protein